MKTYEEFENQIIEALAGMLDYDEDIIKQEVRKTNDLVLHGIVIQKPGVNASPIIYLDEYYDSNKKGMSVKFLAGVIKERYDTLKLENPLDLSSLNDFDSVKDLIVMRLVNTESNSELLKNTPSVPFLDMSITFAIQLFANDADSASIPIRNSHLKLWGVTVKELYERAKRNTPTLLGYDLRSLADFLLELSDTEVGDRPDNWMYIATNKIRTFGASVIVNKEHLRDFAEKVNGDFFILPSSVNEVILLKDDKNTDPASLSATIKAINGSMLSPDEVLSDHPYKYVRELDEVIAA